MLSFKHYLIESTSADLYHGTSFDNVHSILKKGKISASENGRTSTSRSRHGTEHSYGAEAHFVLDQEKIRHRQSVKPTDWHQGGSVKDKADESDRDHQTRRAESEESVKGDVSLKHAKALVVKKKIWDKFTGPKTDDEHKREEHVKKHPDEAWAFKGMMHSDRMKKVKQFKSSLAKHPHIKLVVKDY